MSARPAVLENGSSGYIGDSMSRASRPRIRICPLYPTGGPNSYLTDTFSQFPAPPPELPEWFHVLAEDIFDLTRLPEGWDSYGGGPIDQETTQAAISAIHRILVPGLPRPVVFAESAGGVGFEFHASGRELTMIVHPSGQISFHYEDLLRHEEQDGEGIPDCLDRLTREN